MKRTKDEVIGVVFSKLKPSREHIFADIGCGTGAVSKFFSPYVEKVYAVDLRLSDEVKSLGGNVLALEMDGREFLERYDVDIVFIGGTKGLDEMLEKCRAKRVAVNSARIEVANLAIRKMKEKGIFKEALIVNIQKSYELAGGTAFKPLNPVFVIVGSNE